MQQQPGEGADGGVVTPEAVRLEFDTAGIGSRAVAYLMDLIIVIGLLLVLLFALTLAGAAGPGLEPWVATTLVLLLVFGIIWGYPTAFETLWRGRTPGKAAMGLRVVTVHGGPVRFRHAAIRALLGLVDFQLTAGFAAVATALLSRRHQRLGDMVAGTIVLRERTGSAPPVAVRFTVPPGAESYAAGIDPSGVTEDDYRAVRTFLLRADRLDAQARQSLAWRIAQPLAERLRHSPPAEVSPELFLRCVAARYQQRSATPTGTSPVRPAPPPAPSGLADDAARAEPPPQDTRPGGFAPPG